MEGPSGRPGGPFSYVSQSDTSAEMRAILLSCALLLGACKGEQPPAPTSEQADQLNEAEAMLNEVAENEEGPADRSTGPSNSSD